MLLLHREAQRSGGGGARREAARDGGGVWPPAQPMKQLQLKSRRFRAEREGDWRRLESLLARVEGRSAAGLSDEELLAIPVLYRATLSSLSVARATSLDHSLIDYLES